MVIEQHPVQFFTAVCHDWLTLLESEKAKQIILESLAYRVRVGQVKVCAFVIMPNHIHLIWRVQNGFALQDVQRDFLKFTALEILKLIRERQGESALERLFVELRDRKFQVWKRNSMSIDLIHEWFFIQKFEYIHNNPLQPRWQLAQRAEDYRYSSASFYETGVSEFAFLCHYDEI